MFKNVWRQAPLKIIPCRLTNLISALLVKKKHVQSTVIEMTKEKKVKQVDEGLVTEKFKAKKSIVSILPPAISEPTDCPLYRPVDAIFSESETRVPVFFPKDVVRAPVPFRLGDALQPASEHSLLVSRRSDVVREPRVLLGVKTRGARQFLRNIAHSGLVSCFGSTPLLPGRVATGDGPAAKAWVRFEHKVTCPPPCKRCKKELKPPKKRKVLPPSICEHPSFDPCCPDPNAFMEPMCKVAIVTGGATGIGFAACYQLLAEGAAHVVIGGIDETVGERAASALNRRFGEGHALFVPADVTRTQDFENLFRTAVDHFDRVDILFNNAGVFDDRNWQQSMDVNVKSVLRGCFLAFRYMGADKGHSGGLVVNNAAVCAWEVVPSTPFYCAAKRAVVAVTECLGAGLYYDCHHVRTITLCPGFTKTTMFKSASSRHVDSSWSRETEKRMHRASVQKMEAVGKAFTFLLRYGRSGRHYLVEDNTIRSVDLPGRPGLCKTIATFM